MDNPSLEQLRRELSREGSINQYYMYLAWLYGSQFSTFLFSYTLEQSQELNRHSLAGNRAAQGFLNTHGGSKDNEDFSSSCSFDNEFFQGAMAEDLKRKDLSMLFMIAEAEQEFTDRPFIRAIDVYYKLNLPVGLSQEQVNQKVRAFEYNVQEDH